MTGNLVFLAGDQAPRLRKHDAEQLARELERVTVIDGGTLRGRGAACDALCEAIGPTFQIPAG